MLSHSRCLCRTLGRSLSALSQGNNVLAGRTTSGDEVVTVNTPPFSESITEGDVRWEKAVGDSVKEDEVVCEIETDKTSLQVPSPAAGVITELLVPDGGRVEAGNPFFKLKKRSRSSQRRPSSRGPCSSSPSPNDGRRPCRRGSTSQTFFCGQAHCTSTTSSSPWGQDREHGTTSLHQARCVQSTTNRFVSSFVQVKINRMRLRIAQRLKEAQQTCAMLTTFNEIDMSNIQKMRKLHKDAFLKRHNIKLGFMSAFIKASAHALMDQPSVNGVIDDTTKEIVYRDYVDISVAVATPKGLVVPVIRNVETMNFADIEKTINGLGEKARNNVLAVEDMDGGTFTISNGGVFGSMFGTPIINPPQSAILGMHGIFDRPVAIGGKVEIRPMMYVALTYDHRLVDGREAVTFLRKIKSVVEDPRVLLLDM
ncbi:LOW QUALITY PROTEIN: dihydrolipoyllysine-residue succinyltransferase component of 2-oxoglutarate dehydrogenase complex, mitochondrial [Oncorhynchus mykiss]|uniref:LOW QUALITY PROTEIN: dihydrolipoyllysine-residue succinyltransferase component of 2-oxoglutarate dehydrogenase complex, mitochondrial n=1 Tax=Oncorhynchus mykiss TaxID=8022 RepID=UPI0018779646|nr:LOW QUALITY PROTEIN: dihydrolipoyllysine-residue succinyltransferase component of 2-oxoglutarate dehydrogenase complex, mitochondrial [Oncorhynchus mykiss]